MANEAAETLGALSDGLAAAVASAGPSVARVDDRHRYPASGIVWSADGVIVTASHVVRREEDIKVGVGEESVPAEFVGRDPATPTVPAADVKRIVEVLLADGAVSRGYLGITPQPARLPADLATQLGRETGLAGTDRHGPTWPGLRRGVGQAGHRGDQRACRRARRAFRRRSRSTSKPTLRCWRSICLACASPRWATPDR